VNRRDAVPAPAARETRRQIVIAIAALAMAARYVDRILNAFGIRIPQEILLRTDSIIE
jgi:hypothetical protein